MSGAEDVEVVRVGHEELPLFRQLIRDIAVEWRPQNPNVADDEEAGLDQALRSFDFLASDSFWIVAGRQDGKFVGYASIARIPKMDARVGALYLDELYVLAPYRRRGVAYALLREIAKLGKELSAWRVRLLVGPENEAARELYRKAGYSEGNGLFCEINL